MKCMFTLWSIVEILLSMMTSDKIDYVFDDARFHGTRREREEPEKEEEEEAENE